MWHISSPYTQWELQYVVVVESLLYTTEQQEVINSHKREKTKQQFKQSWKALREWQKHPETVQNHNDKITGRIN